MELLIGKLNHAAHVNPSEGYLLNRIRQLLKRGGKWRPQRLQLWHRLDIQLWMKILQHVTTKEVPINSIVFVKSSVTLWSDTCEYGIGGYSNNGLVWWWRITSVCHGKLTLNLLEFLASAVTIYMTILKIGQGSHILAFIDISSALGCMYKAYFDPVNAESHKAVSGWLIFTLVSNKTYLYSQHIFHFIGSEEKWAVQREICFFRSWNTLPCALNLKPKFEFQTSLMQNYPAGTSELIPLGKNSVLHCNCPAGTSELLPFGVYSRPQYTCYPCFICSHQVLFSLWRHLCCPCYKTFHTHFLYEENFVFTFIVRESIIQVNDNPKIQVDNPSEEYHYLYFP